MQGNTEPHPDIVSRRLRLVLMSPEFMRASLEGRLGEASALIGAALPESWADGHAARIIQLRYDQRARDPAAAPWLLRAMVDVATSCLVGYVNFHGAPADGRAELGYTVLEPYRRQGFASEAALAMMRWAHQEHAVSTFVVSISPQNQPSLALAEKLGFGRTGTQIDEVDGEQWVFELSWRRRASLAEVIFSEQRAAMEGAQWPKPS